MIFVNAPKEVFDMLMLREGWRNKVYLDSVGKPTVGVGHLLTDGEHEKYPVGSIVPSDVLDELTATDVQHAYNAAVNQAESLGVDSQDFVNALTSVNFQLGTSWHSKFPQTWKLLMASNWQGASEEVKKSMWYKQTPIRVQDFINALSKL